LIDQNRIKEPHSIPAFRTDVHVQSRIDEASKRSEEGHTEIKIITHNDDFDALEQEWNELAWVSDTHIFQTYEWSRIWWKHFGTSKKLHIVAVYTGNKLAGIAPLFEDDVTLFGHKVYSCLRFLGSYVSQPEGEPLMGIISYSDYLDCIIHPGYEQIFYQLILQHLVMNRKICDEIILDEIPEESTIWQNFIPAIEKHGLSCKIEKASSSPVIQLESSWESYLSSMNSKERYNVLRYFKRAQNGKSKEFDILQVKHADELHEVLNELIRMHQQQWNDRGFAGTFAETRMKDFFTEITELFFGRGWMQLKMAVPADKSANYVAIDALPTYKNRVYMMHRGMENNSRYRKLGPGNVLLYTTLKEAIQNNIKTFDFLRGMEDFKLREATKVNQNKRVIVYDRSDTGRQLSGLVKKYIKLRTRLRLEKMHFKVIVAGKPFTEGIKGYALVLNERIRHKLNK
jgi:CelD/BcsL family acetyltransferase involved in cellulose biosynthesis